MAIGPNLPSVEQVLDIAEDFGLELSADEACTYRKLAARLTNDAYLRLDRKARVPSAREEPAHSGLPASGERQPLQRLVLALRDRLCAGGARSPATTVDVKDAICEAGVPMMNVSRVLDGFIPRCLTPTVVTRLLDAGRRESSGRRMLEDRSVSRPPVTPARSVRCAIPERRATLRGDHRTSTRWS